MFQAKGDDLSCLDALVIGPPDTPYDGALLPLGLSSFKSGFRVQGLGFRVQGSGFRV